jgi:hypothetical protein
MEQLIHAAGRIPWNKGKLVGQKAPLKLKDIWAIRVRLQIGHRTRELALFNLAIDSKLRSCDLVTLRVRDVCHGSLAAKRAIVIQQKTQRPAQFEITEQTRESLLAWVHRVACTPTTICFRAAPADRRTSPRDSMLGSSTAGSA